MIIKADEDVEVENPLQEEEEEPEAFGKDGLDSQYNERMKRRMEAAKKAVSQRNNYAGDTSINSIS